ncbi:YigZ family protein [Sebaldella sp. S0638]|uniref:IMPACT family protein n=1 Tax=Sebaldella sp. S0638 TaxID=2957809 RepID=UPI00209E543E|nr:YigZ family protein [Sebaldella sp. S0638]MCP1224161.1 IMPACT family protein [Sebaldella sp. S0638]
MNTVKNETIIEFEEKKSRFIGYIKPVSSVKEAEKFINGIREMHPNATHNVPLYRVVENGQEYFKYNDDGEPSNTAGKPMAEILNILDVYNVALVATRYFGGIKLGAGGLIRNYAKTAKLAVNEAKITEYREKVVFILDYDYSMTSEMESFFAKSDIKIIEQNYLDRISVKIEADKEQADEIEALNGVIVVRL